MRWEYVDRSQVHFHHLWTSNPDGTGQTVFYGNAHPGLAMLDAKPIPNPPGSVAPWSGSVIASFSPGHGRPEHAGHVTVVDPRGGPDYLARARQVSVGQPHYRDPYPITGDCFLAVDPRGLVVMDGSGATELIYALARQEARFPLACHEPSPLASRLREPALTTRARARGDVGRLLLADVRVGRSMNGIGPGEIKRLLVLEQLPKPVNFSGVQQNLSMNGTFTLKRILGTVPVEPDGSAHFEVPALRSVYFAALDEQGKTVRRMQSFVTLMPGETTGCVGCHEHRTDTGRLDSLPAAMTRAPSRIQPIADVPDVIDYPRDIQPILDKHCVRCHSAEKPEGRVVLTGDYNEWFTVSYYALFAARQVSDSWGYSEDGNHAPRDFGSPASDLMKKLDGRHYEVRLSDRERRLVQLWIDTGATYPGTYAALRPGIPPSSGHTQPDPQSFPPRYGSVSMGPVPGGKETLESILKRRCLTCHDAKLPMGSGFHKTQVHLNVPKHYCLNLYNLTHPEKSLILRAPLAKEAGGYQWCRPKADRADLRVNEKGTVRFDVASGGIFADTKDPDYQAILRAVELAKAQTCEMKRFDMPGFRPTTQYVREMKRYGVLPADFDVAKDPIDVYQVDRDYWRSLWYQPARTAEVSGSVH